MKARIKATGEIVEVRSKVMNSIFSGENILKYIDQHTGVSYFEDELFFPKDLNQASDYWTRLEHQYAGMVMQALIVEYRNAQSTHGFSESIIQETCAKECIQFAHILVEKLKEKEERK